MKAKNALLGVLAVLAIAASLPANAADAKQSPQVKQSDIWFWYDQEERLMKNVYRPVVQSAATWLNKRDWVDAVCGTDKACRWHFHQK